MSARKRRPSPATATGQLRLGVHLTGFKFDDAEWSAAAGWSDDSDHRSSLYVRFGVLTRR